MGRWLSARERWKRDRRIIYLHEVLGLTFKQVGERLGGYSDSYICSLYYRAKRLRRKKDETKT